MYRNIYYDYKNNKIHLWETISGKKIKDVIDAQYYYYVEDETGKSDIKDIFGTPVVKKFATNKKNIKELKNAGVKCFETDYQEDMKFLHDRYGITELTHDIKDFNAYIIDIEVAMEDKFDKACNANFPINLITLKNLKKNDYYTFALNPYTGTSDIKNYFYCRDEKVLLESFLKMFRKLSVDILTGWNVEGFDVPYIVNRCKKLGITKSLSPIDIVDKKINTEEEQYNIAGISVLDYMNLYKNFTKDNRESYTLQYISQFELGEGKLEFEGSINDLYKRDWNKFVEYNIQDTTLISKLEDKLNYIDLCITLCYESLIPFEKIYSSISVITGYMLKYLHKKNIVMPDRPHHEVHEFVGAYVFAKPGHYKNIISFDVESLYPTIIQQFRISPETLIYKKQYKLIINNKEKTVYEDDLITVKRKNENIEEILIKNLQNDDEII